MNDLTICFEDEYLLVIDKPAGVLSQPGKTLDGSIATQVREAYPDATGPLLVHRLDMDTSGLMVLAKNRQVHRGLQQQFEHRKIGKRYIAVVSKPVQGIGGCITLPVRLDIDNRPTQIVCREFGKSAQTLWCVANGGRLQKGFQEEVREEVREKSNPDRTRLVFQPITGRTHQLRVHAAHPLGLNAAIVGDRLYGHADKRLLLHAEQLAFTHPITLKRVTVHAAAPF